MAEPARTQRTIIVVAFAIPGAMAIAIIGMMLFMWAQQREVPKDLVAMGGLATGWVFGALHGFVKTFLEAK